MSDDATEHMDAYQYGKVPALPGMETTAESRAEIMKWQGTNGPTAAMLVHDVEFLLAENARLTTREDQRDAYIEELKAEVDRLTAMTDAERTDTITRELVAENARLTAALADIHERWNATARELGTRNIAYADLEMTIPAREAAARREEREACAKIADEHHAHLKPREGKNRNDVLNKQIWAQTVMASDIATAIRARSQS